MPPDEPHVCDMIEEPKAKKPKKSSVFEIKIGLRGPVYADDGGYCTTSSDVIASDKVTSDIKLVEFRTRLIGICERKNILIDSIAGQLFVAHSTNGTKMKTINSAVLLGDAFAKARPTASRDKMVQFGFGAPHPDYDPTMIPAASQDSGEGIKHLNLPPFLDSTGTKSLGVRAAAKASVTTINQVRTFLEMCYTKDDSTMHHAFTRYHYGVMFNFLQKSVKDGEGELITDVASGQYPKEEDWHKYSPDGTWNTAQHKSASQNCVMKRGAHPPDEKGQIPMADLCARRRKSGTGSSKDADDDDDELKMMRLEMRRSNDIKEHGHSSHVTPTAQQPVGAPAQKTSVQALLEKIAKNQQLQDIAVRNNDADLVDKYTKKIN
jgi:hypothetical protein